MEQAEMNIRATCAQMAMAVNQPLAGDTEKPSMEKILDDAAKFYAFIAVGESKKPSKVVTGAPVLGANRPVLND